MICQTQTISLNQKYKISGGHISKNICLQIKWDYNRPLPFPGNASHAYSELNKLKILYTTGKL